MPRRRRSALIGTGLLAVVLAASGCSGDDGGSDDAPLGERPSLPTEAPALWNPCDGLDANAVEEAFDTSFDESTGTDSAPECTFRPSSGAAENSPVVDVNYQLFAGSLAEMIGTFGEPTEGTSIEVTAPDVPQADDARLVVSIDEETLFVSGFVQNGQLVQLVNVVDPGPFDRARDVAAVKQMLGDLAAHAAGSEVADD
ncbi:hypothetical protein [Nocardioides sp. R-C-SC26]|uniref:hypothetical protein n=1 Tax=Nocardioides sp. R-C-SC26 TaxID=2870414 RepID=UPI001E3F894E|nr:hypothetical protein [Nocardioides sp. R-C-SC26]